jgi:hypothetical protein
VIATVDGDVLALLAMEILPLTAPVACGANCAVSVTLCEGANVTAEPPLRVKPVPLMLALEIATLALPVFVTVMLFVAVLPTVTLPKLTLAGFTDKLEVAATPVPLSANAAVAVVALLTIDTLPVAAPALFGANCSVKEVFAPAAKVAGKVIPVMLKPVPLTLAAEIVTLALLGLLICTI